MSILAKNKQLNNGYFFLPYALMGKPPAKSKRAEKLFGKRSEEQVDNGYRNFIPKDKNHLSYTAQTLLGLIHTNEKIFNKKAEFPYRKITDKIGHSSKTTAANLKKLKEILEQPERSTYHIKASYDDKPFILCYDFLFTDELQLDEGQAPVKLSDLEARFVSLIVNNKLNPNRSEEFVASVSNVMGALNIPRATAQSMIESLTNKGVCTCYRLYKDEKGNDILVKGEKAKSKNEKTLITVHSRIIRLCNVICKEYKKRHKEKVEQQSKRPQGKQMPSEPKPPKELTDEEKFDVIEKKFIRDKKYLNLTEKYKALKSQRVDVLFKEKDEEKADALDQLAKATFNELCFYLIGNGVRRDELPKTFSQILRTL